MSQDSNKRFNIRVYGILIQNNAVLLSDEQLNGFRFTKFPGGGLEFGEGPVECILREMQEETGLSYQIIKHFYTTDFYQASAFHKEHQIISIYYLIEGPNPSHLLSDKIYDFLGNENQQKLRWVKFENLSEEDVTFPIDKKVIQLLLQEKI